MSAKKYLKLVDIHNICLDEDESPQHCTIETRDLTDVSLDPLFQANTQKTDDLCNTGTPAEHRLSISTSSTNTHSLTNAQNTTTTNPKFGAPDNLNGGSKNTEAYPHDSHPGILKTTNFGASMAQMFSESFSSSPSRFKVSLPTRASTTNIFPWNATGRPRDAREVELLIDLTRLMAEWGAPIYRVENRIITAAKALEIPISFFSLPSMIMVNIGDGGAQHPSRTVFIQLSSSMNMWKLHQADRLARRLGLIYIRFEKLKMRVLSKHRKEDSVYEHDDHVGLSEHAFSSPPATSASSKPPHQRTTTSKMFRSDSIASATSKVIGRGDEEPVAVEEIIQDLRDLAEEDDSYSSHARVLSSLCTSGFIVILLFGGSLSDAIAASVLGALATAFSIIAEELEMQTVSVIFIAGTVSFFSRIAQTKYIWSMVPGSPFGLCHDIVSLAGLVQFMPGMQFTLAMLELGSDYSVSGALRLFNASMRSIMVGYGATFGSRFAVTVLQTFEAWAIDDTLKACPSPDLPYTIDFWRLPAFIPMTVSIMIFLKAHPSQWLPIITSSFIGFMVSTISRLFFTTEMTSVFTSFSLGIVSNLLARYRDNIAIASVLAGIFWLVPGSVGVRGAIAAFSGDASGTSFGVQIIVRAMSIAVGLFAANAIVFPIGPRKRQVYEEDSLAV
ncbi:hypothetical protein QVD99_004546 [Batrachochytrium dendrobatidis]|nr:hypothetical protein O5D80_002783 [Batrachochytrium dendrobatidis]KAK5668752.1 hypothetical protein QVD99_004546 [Batrachochytrium dendrobatidis]